MGYEDFSGSSRGAAQAKISLRKSNSIGVNSKALEEFFEEEHEHAEVKYDSEDNKLAINPKEEATDISYKITRSASGGTIAPTSDLKANNLVPDITTQYAPETEKVNQNTEYVVIHLDNPIGTHGSRDEDKPEKNEITEEDMQDEDVDIEEKAEQ